jgi:hypothetical protein
VHLLESRPAGWSGRVNAEDHSKITIGVRATRVDHPGRVADGQPGASNRPTDTAEATSQHATVPSPNRAATAPAAAVIATRASAQSLPAGPGSTGSAANARHHQVNTARTASTRVAKRRNQPRTVSAARPSPATIRRCPAPAAFATRAEPITAATSARRTSTNTGNNT